METIERPTLITIFGATGDLARRKLFPSIYRLYKNGYLNKNFAVIGTARREWDNKILQQTVFEAISDENDSSDENQIKKEFISHFYYIAHNINDRSHYQELKKLTESLESTYETQGNRLFYVALAPEHFETVTSHLASEGLKDTDGYTRLVIEKPFGHDYPSAKQLNDGINKAFSENEIFRIDHYLGKEMVQNISAIRFANPIFNSLWNHHYIEHVQITLAETVGVEERGAYYDTSGALRDMVQNHVLQIISLLAMEPPANLNSSDVRKEKIKALAALKPLTDQLVLKKTIRGQYRGYRDEENISKDSTTETFVAGEFYIDNFRWQGVPFFIRTGKKMKEKETVIHVFFKPIEKNLFSNTKNEHNIPLQNVLTIHIAPNEGFALTVNKKSQLQDMALDQTNLHNFDDKIVQMNTPEDYERLILNAIDGDNTYFTHWDEVKYSWQFVDEILKNWTEHSAPLYEYEPGQSGPEESHSFIQSKGFEWV
ncbi:glucose-6-phosphate dehydrogenase [Atopobacter phocae]|uniref:glucose-6-phosphate dehydrogenase n=1 Tax=Atopobacter phocae TaxID=136492 RepID=UPI0004B5830F|nr:glucose-6-phosphate dehydrogenase [Atopobacter phocae]